MKMLWKVSWISLTGMVLTLFLLILSWLIIARMTEQAYETWAFDQKALGYEIKPNHLALKGAPLHLIHEGDVSLSRFLSLQETELSPLETMEGTAKTCRAEALIFWPQKWHLLCALVHAKYKYGRYGNLHMLLRNPHIKVSSTKASLKADSFKAYKKDQNLLGESKEIALSVFQNKKNDVYLEGKISDITLAAPQEDPLALKKIEAKLQLSHRDSLKEGGLRGWQQARGRLQIEKLLLTGPENHALKIKGWLILDNRGFWRGDIIFSFSGTDAFSYYLTKTDGLTPKNQKIIATLVKSIPPKADGSLDIPLTLRQGGIYFGFFRLADLASLLASSP